MAVCFVYTAARRSVAVFLFVYLCLRYEQYKLDDRETLLNRGKACKGLPVVREREGML